jgi:N-acetylmuramoyl-L-alanine amidase
VTRSTSLYRSFGLALGGLLLAGCASGPGPAPAIGPPPIPLRTGGLRIDVVYPPARARIAVRDSNFIFGSVGDGRARLEIDGRPVEVLPNGSFLAWLPVPAHAKDTLAVYRLVASLGGRVERAEHTVRLPAPPRRGTTGLGPDEDVGPPPAVALDTSGVAPRGLWWVRAGERIDVRVGATPGARVHLLLPAGDSIPLIEVPDADPAEARRSVFGSIPTAGSGSGPGSGLYRGTLFVDQPLGRGARSVRPPAIPADGPVVASCTAGVAAHGPPGSEPIVVGGRSRAREGSDSDPGTAPVDTGVMPRGGMGALRGAGLALRDTGSALDRTAPSPARDCAVLVAEKGGAVASSPLPLDLWVMVGPGPVVRLRDAPSVVGSDGVVIGRPAPGATYAWMWADGVQARVTGRRGDAVRIALDERTEAWVGFDDIDWRPVSAAPSRPARAGTVRLRGRPDRLEVEIAISRPVPYGVSIDGRRLTLTLYDAYSDTDWLRYGPEDPFLRAAAWRQPFGDRYELQLDLAATPWGYRVRVVPGALVLEVRKPPAIDPERPLAGRTVVVDPGHPPAGAVGPTRLYEGDANLAVAHRTRRRLEAEGARVILARADRSAVRLYDRVALAELRDADLLVSIHNNALPDGVNPYGNHGTSVFYFHDHESDLARHLQTALLASLGLADLGIGRANLALIRPTWMPSALTEGAFMMIPEQEAALRHPAFQEAYARGVVDGLRAFLLERAR